jgi:hypothetical protein
MSRLKAVKATEQEQQSIATAIEAVRNVLARFARKNLQEKNSLFYLPCAIIRTSDGAPRFTVVMEGHPASPAVGHTLDEAIENLCASPDASFLRRRAETLMEKARELNREADAMEGIEQGSSEAVTEGGAQ